MLRAVRRATRLAAAVLVGIGVGVGVLAALTPPAAYPQATPAGVPALHQLERIARSYAHVGNDPRTHSGLIVLTQRDEAARSDVVAGGNEPVYELVLRGAFTCDACSRPPGAPAPSGPVITIALSRATLQPTDFGIVDTPPLIPSGAMVVTFSF